MSQTSDDDYIITSDKNDAVGNLAGNYRSPCRLSIITMTRDTDFLTTFIHVGLSDFLRRPANVAIRRFYMHVAHNSSSITVKQI